MRFLNMKLSTPETGEYKIEFTDGLNILSIRNKELFSLISQIPVIGVYGTVNDNITQDLNQISCTINASSAISGQEIKFIFDKGILSIKESDKSGNSIMSGDYESATAEYLNSCTSDNFLTSSFFNPEQIQKNGDPALDVEKLKSLLINNEISRPGFSYFRNRESILRQYEKDFTSLNREKQLLELKKMKKEKLQKEIQISERSIHKLEKRNDSIIKYKKSLIDITELIENKNKILSRINNLKKDFLDLRDIKDKISSVEKTLKEKFAHFSDEGNEQIPDLEQIQESFNTFRDINEQLDKFYLNKKFYSEWSLRVIASMIIFSCIALIFFIFTSTSSFALGLTSILSSIGAGVTGLIYYFKIRELYPKELIEQKSKMEESLIELLKKNNFSVDNCKTGELYEILFQYFEDFINYRDINYELIELKKKISNSATLAEKEKKLDELDNEVESINNSITETVENLDHSIHATPQIESINKTIHEIDDLLEENQTEIAEKKSLIIKFKDEIDLYDKTENSAFSLDFKLEDVFKQIDQCRENIEHVKFLNNIFNEASEIWCSEKLDELSRVSLEKFLKLTDNSFIKDDIAESISNIMQISGRIKSEHKGLKKYIAFSIKAALSELLVNGDFPPVFFIDPFNSENEFAENMKKLLPEFFHERQVVLIIPGDEPDFKGNLITL